MKNTNDEKTAANVSAIITRNPKDYARSTIPVYIPTDFLQIPYWLEDSDTMILNEPEIKYHQQ